MNVTNYEPDDCMQVIRYLQAHGMPVIIWPQASFPMEMLGMYGDEPEGQQLFIGEQTLQEEIAADLVQMGFRRGQAGFMNIVLAISEILQHKGDMQVHLTREIYPRVAECSGTTESSVERTIRNAIESVWKRSNLAGLERLYPYPCNNLNGRPTNAEFLINMAAKYRRH